MDSGNTTVHSPFLLNIVSLNVNGLTSKLNAGIIDMYLVAYDIICLSETLTDSIDLSQSLLSDFESYCLPRRCGQKFGGFHGMSILMKKYVFEHSLMLDNTSSPSVIWVKIQEEILGYEFILGAVYLPCDGSIYQSQEIFDYLVQDLINLQSKYNVPFCLVGDLNARTGSLADYLDINDDAVSNILGLNFCDGPCELPKHAVPTKRINMDTKINNNGYEIIDLCKSFGLTIVNGRLGDDNMKGNFTCFNKNGGCSTVDDAIVSCDLFHNVQNFQVDLFDKCLSDVHCPIIVTLQSKHTFNETSNEHLMADPQFNTVCNFSVSKFMSFKWDPEKVVEYSDRLHGLTSHLQPLKVNNYENISQDMIDNYYSTISGYLLQAAQDVGVCKWKEIHKRVDGSRGTGNSQSQLWFDAECAAARREYFNLKNRLNRKIQQNNRLDSQVLDCDALQSDFHLAGKRYKKLLRYKRRAYGKTISTSLRSLKKAGNPRAFWDLLNSSSKSNKSKTINVQLHDLEQHFKSLGNVPKFEEHSRESSLGINDMEIQDEELNKPITLDEVELMINKLKNSKACGKDMVRNEFLKCSPLGIRKIIVNLFNIVLESGIVPSEWCVGVIIPIFKNKGESTNPDNYRGITLLSCLGKLFTSVLHHRISTFLDDSCRLGEEQAGFRSKYSTIDHVFVLKSIVDFYLQKRKRLYCAFIDYRKAFDLIDRKSLWYKLIKIGVNGKILNVVRNLYQNAKSCISSNGEVSDFFTCNVGVRQGENLSPLLFAVYLNDFQEHMSKFYPGLKTLNEDINSTLQGEDIEHLSKLSCLLYADDTIIMAESPDELQTALHAVSEYCRAWNLTVNASKTKIMIFSRGKIRRMPNFIYGNEKIDVVFDFTYLGVQFNYNGTFKKAISRQIIQARKALYSMLTKAKKMQLSVDIQCHLFDHLILPILMYGSEVWGYEDIKQIEIFHRKFLKTILSVSAYTPDCMVYGETGRGLILSHVKRRVINFWSRIMRDEERKYSYVFLKFISSIHKSDQWEFNSSWLNFIEQTLNNAGLSNLWITQNSGLGLNINSFMKLRLNDIFLQEWREAVWSNRICTNYRIFKDNNVLENYLLSLNKTDANNLSKFRCRSHNLPVNRGRFDANTLHSDMQCSLCLSNDIGDEFHYIFACPFFEKERRVFLPQQFLNIKLYSALHMRELFDTRSISRLKNLAKFARIIMLQFSVKREKQHTSSVSQSVNRVGPVQTRSGRIVKQPDRFAPAF